MKLDIVNIIGTSVIVLLICFNVVIAYFGITNDIKVDKACADNCKPYVVLFCEQDFVICDSEDGEFNGKKIKGE